MKPNSFWKQYVGGFITSLLVLMLISICSSIFSVFLGQYWPAILTAGAVIDSLVFVNLVKKRPDLPEQIGILRLIYETLVEIYLVLALPIACILAIASIGVAASTVLSAL